MHTLRRNQQEVTYRNYSGQEEIIKDGMHTGEKKTVYSDPVTLRMRRSCARGQVSDEVFGVGTNYTRTLITDDVDIDIDEHTIFTIEGDEYGVVKIARSLNHTMIAIKEIEDGAK